MLRETPQPGLEIPSLDGITLSIGYGQSVEIDQKKGLDQCKLLFARPIHVVEEESVRVQVYSQKRDPETGYLELGRLLASRTLQSTKKSSHAWMTWKIESNKKQMLSIENVAEGIALPHVPEMRPTVVEGTVEGQQIRWPRNRELPKLIPTNFTTLKCSLTDDILNIESDREISLDSAGHAILVRWWVNDQPFYPKQLAREKRLSGFRTYIPQPAAKKIRVRLKINRKALGANKGDRIGLQLLECPELWLWVDRYRTRIRKSWHGDDWPMISNRIDFTLD